jgi:hypothetical protein
MTAKLGMMPSALDQELQNFLDRINKITGFFLGLWIHFKPRKRRKARKVCLGWVIGLMGPIGLIAKDVLCCSFTIHYSLFTIHYSPAWVAEGQECPSSLAREAG